MRGVVADTSGAVIPDATVKARNTATNAEAQVVSKEDGSYAFESLVPGNYEVSSEKTGFKTLVATDTRVEAQKTTTLNVQLQVGEVSDQVTVEGAATQVDVSTPTLQTTLNTQALLSLPVQGRNVRLAAESIQPGAVVQGNGNVSYNGNRSASGNNYKVDGGDVNNYFNGLASENSTFPQAENLEEFSVLTNSTDAKYGNASGAQVTAVVKSGTNDLHGMGWGYFENQGLAANSWASNRQGVARVPGSQRWLGATSAALSSFRALVKEVPRCTTEGIKPFSFSHMSILIRREVISAVSSSRRQPSEQATSAAAPTLVRSSMGKSAAKLIPTTIHHWRKGFSL
ncbi:MAG: carboxypeptidase-like regulatory domain-containing protein [Pyrinomonadaceae bacterium]